MLHLKKNESFTFRLTEKNEKIQISTAMKLKNLLLNSTVCKLPVKLISVRGKDSFALIQSLLTNNVDTLWPARKDFPSSIYGMFLSLNGRVIFDTILYSSNESNEMNLYLECNISEINPMLAHLKKYRMRKKGT